MESLTDFNAAYDNSAAVPGAAALIAGHSAAAAAFRAGAVCETLAYGAHPRMRLDLFRPEGAPRGLAVFVHGGYWRMTDRTDWSHVARGPLGCGLAVAVAGYPLCPEVGIGDIARAVAAAIARAASMVPGPVVLYGHSAGGHLVSRMACADGPLDAAVAARLGGVLGISGVYDLRPLLHNAMNADLRLDMTTATAESPLLAVPRAGTRLIAWVGAAELPEFRRQSAAMASLWHGLGVETRAIEAPARHHFDVIDPLTEPDSALTQALVGLAASA